MLRAQRDGSTGVLFENCWAEDTFVLQILQDQEPWELQRNPNLLQVLEPEAGPAAPGTLQ